MTDVLCPAKQSEASGKDFQISASEAVELPAVASVRVDEVL
jgi:hypothetical protein